MRPRPNASRDGEPATSEEQKARERKEASLGAGKSEGYVVYCSVCNLFG
tara:strand:+ start:136 stop:282 length:147 start_codon:yes stop_codon:yes gene_type:complete